jgi:hypothetical protein
MLVYTGRGGREEFHDFELLLTGHANGSVLASLAFLARPSDPTSGWRVRVNQKGRTAEGRPERIQTGSLLRHRNVFKRWTNDDQPFDLLLRVQGPRVQISVDGRNVVDTILPGSPDSLSPGAIGLVWDGGDGRFHIHDLRLRRLSPAALPNPAPLDDISARLDALQASGFPLIDLHVHLKGISPGQAVAHSLLTGINLGIAPNCGLIGQGLPGVTPETLVSDDAGLDAFRQSLAGQPVFLGMQGEGREWSSLFSAEARRPYDYVFTDCLTFDDRRGRRIRLWIPEEVEIDDAQAFMDGYVEKILGVIRYEPIDLFANPTFLPDCLIGQYDALWTEDRIDRVIEALGQKGVPLEINARFRIPRANFVRRARQAGLRFTFGTNNVDACLGRLEYCLEMIDSCGLTAEDMFIPNRA